MSQRVAEQRNKQLGGVGSADEAESRSSYSALLVECSVFHSISRYRNVVAEVATHSFHRFFSLFFPFFFLFLMLSRVHSVTDYYIGIESETDSYTNLIVLVCKDCGKPSGLSGICHQEYSIVFFDQLFYFVNIF